MSPSISSSQRTSRASTISVLKGHVKGFATEMSLEPIPPNADEFSKTTAVSIISRLTSDADVTPKDDDEIAKSLGMHEERSIWIEVKTSEGKPKQIPRRVRRHYACWAPFDETKECWLEQLIREGNAS
jgi:hypothetical protein